MGIKCRINRNEIGEVDFVTTESGKRSKLFDDLSNIVGKAKALDLVALANSSAVKTQKAIKDVVKTKRNKNSLGNQSRELSSFLGSVPSKGSSYMFSLGSTSIYYTPKANKRVELELVETPSTERGKGSAKAAMEDFLKKVGSQGFTVDLIVAPRDKTTKEGKLKSFYKNLGFIENGTDFEMTRRPMPKDNKASNTVTLFHGTAKPLVGEFDTARSNTSDTIFLTDSENFANEFSFNDEMRPNGVTYTVTANLENTFDSNSEKSILELEPLIRELVAENYKYKTGLNYRTDLKQINIGERVIENPTQEDFVQHYLWRAKSNWRLMESPRVIEYLKSKGYDSFTIKERGANNIAVFDSSKVNFLSYKDKFGQSGVNNITLEEIEEEVSVDEIMSYAVSTNEGLSEKEHIDLQNTVYSLGLNSYSELKGKLKKGLIKNGVIVFTEKTLKDTNLFNTYETNSILNSIELQESIKKVYQGLLKENDRVFEAANPAYIIKTSKINSIGKQEISNPFHVEQEVATIVAGKEVEIILDTIPYDSVKNLYLTNKEFKEELNNVANNTRNLPVIKIVGDEIENKTENSNRELFEKTIDFDLKQQIEPIINTISMISEGVWRSSENSVYTLLKEFNSKAALAGVDFMDLEDRILTESQDDIVGLIEAFSDLLAQPTENNMDYFFDVYSEFFGVSEEPLIKTVITDKTNGVFLETDISEVSLFNEFGLIKQGENIYEEVEPISDIEEAYDILLQNKEMLPTSVETVQDLKEYISSIIEGYNLDSFEVNMNELENMIIHKIYFKAPITISEVRDSKAEVKHSNFSGDYNYLNTQFVSDFYKMYLKEKKAMSAEYKDFYSNFRFDEKGITLVNTDPITLAKMEPYRSPELEQYNLISKNLNMPLKGLEITIDKNEMQFNRENAISNPTSVDKVKGDYTILSPETIAVKGETKAFVRTPKGVFEYEYQIGDVALYNKLPEGDEYYNSYGQHPLKPNSSIDVKDYGNMESIPGKFVEAKKYYSKEELKEINESNFSC